jgi:hypothetical protein
MYGDFTSMPFSAQYTIFSSNVVVLGLVIKNPVPVIVLTGNVAVGWCATVVVTGSIQVDLDKPVEIIKVCIDSWGWGDNESLGTATPIRRVVPALYGRSQVTFILLVLWSHIGLLYQL